MKWIMGVTAIVAIIFLIVGPMILFSSAFSVFGSTNPITKADFKVQFGIMDQDNEPLIKNQDFFEQKSTFMFADFTQDDYDHLGF